VGRDGELGPAAQLGQELAVLRQQAGKDPYKAVSRELERRCGAGPRESVLSSWFKGTHVPSNPSVFRHLILILNERAVARGVAPHSLRSPDAWARRLEELRSEQRRGRRHTKDDPADAVTRTEGCGQDISSLHDPLRYGVHPVIELSGDDDVALPVLPPYVLRAHDERLRRVALRAVTGGKETALLVAGSSAGKTRACWEAVRNLPTGWKLWRPLDAADLVEGVDRVAARTVVWLDGAERLLLDDDRGEEAAKALNSLLDNEGHHSLLILATMWRESWARITPQGKSGHPQVRYLFAHRQIVVPEEFQGAAETALRELAAVDPRLAYAAANAECGQVAQLLAGAKCLMDRYHAAPPIGQVLIEAAWDASRLGHGPVQPLDYLRHAAPAYLTDNQWHTVAREPEWFGDAVQWAQANCLGVAGPLSEVHPRPGQQAFDSPHVRLADYLDQRGRSARRLSTIPDGIWEILLLHADREPAALRRLGRSAASRGLLRIAVGFYRLAAELGSSAAMVDTGDLLHRHDRNREAIPWYIIAAEAAPEDPIAQQMAGMALCEDGRLEEALPWYVRASAALPGNPYAMSEVAELLEELGRTKDAESWSLHATFASAPYRAREIAEYQAQQGRSSEAIAMFDALARQGLPGAAARLVVLLWQHGEPDRAMSWFRRAAVGDDGFLPVTVVAGVMAAGPIPTALQWLEKAADSGLPVVSLQVAQLLAEAHHPLARTWYQRALEASPEHALQPTVEFLGRTGQNREAEHLISRHAALGQPAALRMRADELAACAQWDEALTAYHLAARSGCAAGLAGVAAVYRATDRQAEADRLLLYGWEPGGLIAEPWTTPDPGGLEH